jgi:hypothetical protein
MFLDKPADGCFGRCKMPFSFFLAVKFFLSGTIFYIYGRYILNYK